MDQQHLEALASKKSQELQLLQRTLGKSASLDDMEASIMGRLTRDTNWRWLPSHGLQVAIPQDSDSRWISREPPRDLENRIRQSILPDPEPDPNAGRALEKQEYVWLLAQILHYGLGFAATPVDAAAVIADALLKGKLQQPSHLAELSRRLRGDYESQKNTQQQGNRLQLSMPRRRSATRGKQATLGAGPTGQDLIDVAPSIATDQMVVKIPKLSEKAKGKLRATSSILPDSDLEDTRANASQSGSEVEGFNDGDPGAADSSADAQPPARLCTDRESHACSSTCSARRRQSSPPIQVLGEGVFGGVTNWLIRPLSLSRWITQVCSPRQTNGTINPASNGKGPVAGVKGHPILIIEKSAGDATHGWRGPPTGHGTKTTTGVSNQRNVTATEKAAAIPCISKSTCSMPPNKLATGTCNRSERRPSIAPSRIDNAFPVAKPSAESQLGKARASTVPTDGSSGGGIAAGARQTEPHCSKGQNRADSKTRSLRNRFPSRESDANALARSAERSTKSKSKAAKRPSTSAHRATTQNDNSRKSNSKGLYPRPAETQDAVTDDQADSDDLKKKQINKQKATDHTKHPHCTAQDAKENPPRSKSRPSSITSSNAAAAAHSKSQHNPPIASTTATRSPSPERGNKPENQSRITVDELGSLPPSSDSELSPMPTSQRGRKSKKAKAEAASMNIRKSTAEVQATLEIVIQKPPTDIDRVPKVPPMPGRHVSTNRPTLERREGVKRGRTATFDEADKLNERGQDSHRAKKKAKKEEEIETRSKRSISDTKVVEADAEDKKSGPSVPSARHHQVAYHGSKMKYVMDCDENGVPAERPPFRRDSPQVTHTIRDQVGNPLFRKDVIREETPLDLFLENDHETRMKDSKARASHLRRGGFHRRAPERSGNVLQMPKTTGRGSYHKKIRSTRMPMRNFSFRRPRGC